MADVSPPRTIADYQQLLEATLNTLDEVLSGDPDMPSYAQTMADADQWLDDCRRAIEQTGDES